MTVYWILLSAAGIALVPMAVMFLLERKESREAEQREHPEEGRKDD